MSAVSKSLTRSGEAPRSKIVERSVLDREGKKDPPQQSALALDNASILQRIARRAIALIFAIQNRSLQRTGCQQPEQGCLAATGGAAHEHQAAPRIRGIAQNLHSRRRERLDELFVRNRPCGRAHAKGVSGHYPNLR